MSENRRMIGVGAIKIPRSYRNSNPASFKLDKVRKYYQKYGRLDKPIMIDEDYVLIDGYTRYIIAIEEKLTSVECIIVSDDETEHLTDKEIWERENKNHLDLGEKEYIIAKFPNRDKEYIWVNTKGLPIDIGDIVDVRVECEGKFRITQAEVVGKFWSATEEHRKSIKSIFKKVGK